MKKLIEKAFKNPHFNYRSIGYEISDYTLNLLNSEEKHQLSLEIVKNKKLLANNATFKKMLKTISAEIEKKVIEDINSAADRHREVIKRKSDKMKEDIAKEAFIQSAAKKLNKKEFQKLKKLLPVDGFVPVPADLLFE